jgi:heptosyltransferase-2
MDKIEKRNFCIIRLSSMGDIVLTTALVRCIKKQYPNANVTFIVGEQFVEILQHNPYIDTLVRYDKATDKLLTNPQLSPDCKIIDLQNNHRSHRICKQFSGDVVQFNKQHLKKLLLVHCKKNLFDSKNIAERYIDTAGINNDGEGLELWLPEEVKASVYPPSSKTNANEMLTFAVAPAAMHGTKQWLPERFVELIVLLAQKYNANFYLLGGKNDFDLCEEICSNVLQSRPSINIANHSGKQSIIDTARLLDECSLLITNDTGVMHIAAARRMDIVAIFGSTVPELGFTPYKTKHTICQVKLKCRPCTHIGRSECPKHHFICMEQITAVNVFEKIIEMQDVI